MVLQRHRCPEHRHDAVAGELVHPAAVPLHHRRAAVGEVGHDLAQPLSTDGRGNVHRMNNIGEQHAHVNIVSPLPADPGRGHTDPTDHRAPS